MTDGMPPMEEALARRDGLPTHFHVYHDLLRCRVVVWFFDRDPALLEARVGRFDPSGAGSRLSWQWESMPEFASLESILPSLVLPPHLWDLMMAKAPGGKDAQQAAVAEHLKDTMTVRDRLLAIVERKVLP